MYEFNNATEKLYELLHCDKVDEKAYGVALTEISDSQKGESFCQMINQLRAEEEMYDNEIKRLTARKAVVSKAKGRMKSALTEFVAASGRRKLDFGTFSVTLVDSHSVVITDMDLIPSKFLLKQPPKVDKSKIRGLLTLGIAVPGTELADSKGIRIK